MENRTERARIKLTTLDKILEVIIHIVLLAAIVLTFVLREMGYEYRGTFMYFILILTFGFAFLQKHNVYPRVFNSYFALNDVKFDIATQHVLYKVILRMFRWITMLLCSLFTYNMACGLSPILQKLKIDIPFWLFIISITFVIIFYISKIMGIINNSKQ